LSEESRADTPESDQDSVMTGTYVRVLVLEVIIFILLWTVARTFS
jgi:hypothetical protein